MATADPSHAAGGDTTDERSMGVRFYPTCLADLFFPESAMAACSVLQKAGCHVDVDTTATCCGQPAFNLGHHEEARAAARRVLDAFAPRRDHDTADVRAQPKYADVPIIVPSGSCATMMHRFYPDLFAGTEDQARAEQVSARVREWSAFLVDELGWRPEKKLRASGAVTIHPSCHALRELGINDQPAALLEAAGYTLVPLPDAEQCCGFGGGFSVEMPEMSGAILADKLAAIERAREAGATTVCALDAGCLMHMRGGHERCGGRNEAPPYVHVAELIDDATATTSTTGHAETDRAARDDSPRAPPGGASNASSS